MKRTPVLTTMLLIPALVMIFLSSCSGKEDTALFERKRLTQEQNIVQNGLIYVDDKEPSYIKVIHYNYRNNRYVSLRDLAYALSDTGKRFQLITEKDGISIITQEDYTCVGGEGEPFAEGFTYLYDDIVYKTYPMDLYPLSIDGRKLHYRVIPANSPAGKGDCFVSFTDIVMQLDLKATMTDTDIHIDTGKGYSADEVELMRDEFYYETHSALLGDADTGEVFLSYDADTSVAIASTSKLMTYLVLMDKASEGVISTGDTVDITAEAADLSRSGDGEILLEPGMKASFSDLVAAMLIPSSDECSLALAIHAAGSEEEFVEWMNEKAGELQMSAGARFYNCHGLPVYTDDIPASKIQNRMSANDMFILVRHILKKYPEILDITSLQSEYLESFDLEVENTNPLLYNVPGVVGLKTGTTDMAGDCVIGVIPAIDKSGKQHYVTVIQFGAEDETIRATLPEELIRYGKEKIETQ